MGYYTYYEVLEVQGESADVMREDFLAGRIETEYGSLNEIFEDLPGHAMDSMKWYGWKADMVSISELYPDTLIVVSGDGEDSDDTWRAYFRNGQSELIYPEIIWPDPSPDLLNNHPVMPPIDAEDLPDEDY